MWRFPMGPFHYKLGQRRIARQKTYDQVRMKPEDEVQVMTDKA